MDEDGDQKALRHVTSGVARLDTRGKVDAAFRLREDISGGVNALALQADGKIFMGGSFTSVSGVPRGGVARLHGDTGKASQDGPRVTEPPASQTVTAGTRSSFSVSATGTNRCAFNG